MRAHSETYFENENMFLELISTHRAILQKEAMDCFQCMKEKIGFTTNIDVLARNNFISSCKLCPFCFNLRK